MEFPEYCEDCELGRSGDKIVWGSGNKNSNLIFIGEAPGKDEAEQLIPFVGKAGKKLRKNLTEIGLNAEIGNEDFYITNIVKHRPPNNRDPLAHERKECQKYILEEIHEIRPKLIITLGRVSSSWWNQGKPFEWLTYYPKRLFMPVHHPMYLIYNPDIESDWKNAIENILISKEIL